MTQKVAQPDTPKAKPKSEVEINDLTIHMRRVAYGLQQGIYDPTDTEYRKLATRLYVLATDIDTFNKAKSCKE